MRPVHEFRANFSLAEPATHHQPDGLIDALTVHDADSQVRNLCLVWEDGRRAFFNYAYLVSVDLVLTDTLNLMLLYFSGQIVTLKGYHLDLLFDLLLNHSPKTIRVSNPRYYEDEKTESSFVTEILVKNE